MADKKLLRRKASGQPDPIIDADERIDKARKRLNGELNSPGLTQFRRTLDEPPNLLGHAWEIYAGALRTQISGGQNWPNLQIVSTPTEIHWDDPQFGDFYFHQALCDYINDVGGGYKKTAKSYSERYGEFITDVLRPAIDESALEKANKAKDQVRQAGKDYFDLVESIQEDWQAFDDRQRSHPPPWVSMEKWYADSKANETLNDSQEILLARQGQYLHWIQLAFGGAETLIKILDKFPPVGPLEVAVPRSGATPRPAGKLKIYDYQCSPDYPTWLANARQDPAPNVDFTIRHDSYQYDYSQTNIGGAVGIGFGFFGIVAGGERHTVQIDTRTQGFELRFQAKVQTFDLFPGTWYSSAFDLFRGGPFFPGSAMDNLLKLGTLFGPRGFISFRPARAIVAYKPIIKIKLWDDAYHYFKQVTEGATGFFIGPFAVGVGEYYDVKESVSWDNNELSLTLYNAPETPHLLAFDSESLF